MMFKKRRNNRAKSEKSRGRKFSRAKLEESRKYAARLQRGPEFQKTSFAVWRAKDGIKETASANLQRTRRTSNNVGPFHDSGRSKRQLCAGASFKVRDGFITSSNVAPSQPLRRSNRINSRHEQTLNIPSYYTARNGNTKSIFEAIRQQYNSLVKEQTRDHEHLKEALGCGTIPCVVVQEKDVTTNVDFDAALHAEAGLGGLRNQKAKVIMNIEDKIRQFNNILKGKNSPVLNRPTLKRKQQDCQEVETPVRLYTPSKYVYQTPENQKYRPAAVVENSPVLVPAVFQTSKKVKVLYDIDQNIAQTVNLHGLQAGLKVPIDNRFLKPICTAREGLQHDNQFLKTPYEYSMNLADEINAMHMNRYDETNKENFQRYKAVAAPLHHFDDNSSVFTLPASCANPFKDPSATNIMDFTFRAVPSTSKYVPAMSIEQEMAVKCTQRPAKIPRMGFHATLSRKSLNFEPSPKSSPQKNYFQLDGSLQRLDVDFDGHGMFEDNAEDDNDDDDEMEGLQLSMNFSLDDKNSFSDLSRF